MKLPLFMIVVFLLFPLHRGALLPPSLPHSVSNHKKTSLSGWPPLPLALLHSPSPLFHFPPSRFSSNLAHLTPQFKLQVASYPA